MQLTEIDIDTVVIKNRIRADLGDLTTLQNSISKNGVLVPIIVDKNNVLISGLRRLTACRNCSAGQIPAIKLDINCNSMQALDIQSDENLCRQPLSSDEISKLIEAKKSAMNNQSPLREKPFFSWIKKLFSKE